MSGSAAIDLSPLRKALGWLSEALMLWREQPSGSVLKPHLRSAVIQSFEFSYELSVRSLRDPSAWRIGRELRNATSHAYDEAKAERVAADAEAFCVDARALLAALEAAA